MKATLNEIVTRVELEEGSMHFSIKPSQSQRFIAELVDNEVSRQTARRYAKIPLSSRHVLAAQDELRDRLRLLGEVSPSTAFWYNLGAPEDDTTLTLYDNDPSHHRVISFRGYTFDLSKTSPRSIAFCKAIAASRFCERPPYWKGIELYIRLRLKYTHQSCRLETFSELLELY